MSFVLVPASYVYLLRDGVQGTEVLLQLRQGTGYMDGHWAAAAAGHVEAGESVLDAAVREADEELGVTIDPVDLAPLCAMHRTSAPHGPVDERVDSRLQRRGAEQRSGEGGRIRQFVLGIISCGVGVPITIVPVLAVDGNPIAALTATAMGWVGIVGVNAAHAATVNDPRRRER